MSERLAHWDDYLLASVMIHCNDIYQCYAVIAAVEDWHRDRWTGVCESPEEVVRELKQAQAVVRRVRELCDESDRNRPRIDGFLINRTLPVKDIRRALDGDSDG